MNYWKNAEQINGRLAMMGFFAAVINYGFTGWVIQASFDQTGLYTTRNSESLLTLTIQKGEQNNDTRSRKV